MTAAAQLIVLDANNVAAKGEMVSLTDLWRVGGSPEGKRPDDWKKDAGNRAFLDHVATVENAPVRGIWKNGNTLAHWHIAMSYARYLDPAFAVRCNEVVRAHMERRLAPTSDFPTELLDMIRRTDGIVRMLAGKVTRIERAVAGGEAPASEFPGFTISIEPTRRAS